MSLILIFQILMKNDEFNSDFSNPEEDRIEYEKRIERGKILRSYEQEGVLEHDKYGFWTLAIFITLIVAFFPWSLLFCVWFYGLDETIYIFKAVINDLFVLAIGLILGLVGLCSIVLFLIYLIN